MAAVCRCWNNGDGGAGRLGTIHRGEKKTRETKFAFVSAMWDGCVYCTYASLSIYAISSNAVSLCELPVYTRLHDKLQCSEFVQVTSAH